MRHRRGRAVGVTRPPGSGRRDLWRVFSKARLGPTQPGFLIFGGGSARMWRFEQANPKLLKTMGPRPGWEPRKSLTY